MNGIGPSVPNPIAPLVDNKPASAAALNPDVASAVLDLQRLRRDALDVELKSTQVAGQREELRGIELALLSPDVTTIDLDAFIARHISIKGDIAPTKVPDASPGNSASTAHLMSNQLRDNLIQMLEPREPMIQLSRTNPGAARLLQQQAQLMEEVKNGAGSLTRERAEQIVRESMSIDSQLRRVMVDASMPLRDMTPRLS